MYKVLSLIGLCIVLPCTLIASPSAIPEKLDNTPKNTITRKDKSPKTTAPATLNLDKKNNNNKKTVKQEAELHEYYKPPGYFWWALFLETHD